MAPGCFSMTQQQQQHDNQQDSTLVKLNNNLEHLNESEFYLDSLSTQTHSPHELACSSEATNFKTNLNANSSCSFVYEYNLDEIPLPDDLPSTKLTWHQLESQTESSTIQLDVGDQHFKLDSVELTDIPSQLLLENETNVPMYATTNGCIGEIFPIVSDSATTVTPTTNEFPLINSSYVSFNNNSNNQLNMMNEKLPVSHISSSTSSTSFSTNYPGYNMYDTIDSFEILEQTIMKQKRLARTKNADLRKKILLKRTFDLVCEIMDQENGINDDLDEETSKSIEENDDLKGNSEVKNKSKTDETFRKKDQEDSSDEEESDEDDDDDGDRDSSSDSDDCSSSSSSNSSESEESDSDQDDDNDDDDDLYNRKKKKLKSYNHPSATNTFEIKCKNEHDLLNTKTILVKLENLNESDLLVSANDHHHQIVHLQSNATVSSLCNQQSKDEPKQQLNKLKRRRHSNSDEDDDDDEEEESDDESNDVDYHDSSLHAKSKFTSPINTRTSINLRYKKFKL
jgi:hypothetical protein